MPIIIILLIIATVMVVRHFHVKNFNTIIPGVLYTSGQPRGMDYTRLLYKYHIATIVNVRLSDEHREDNWYNEEVNWVRKNGVKYVELPITKRPAYFPDADTQAEFLELMADKSNLPVLLHSSVGQKRISMLTAVWLIRAKSYPFADAIDVAEKIKQKSVTKEEKKFIEKSTK